LKDKIDGLGNSLLVFLEGSNQLLQNTNYYFPRVYSSYSRVISRW